MSSLERLVLDNSEQMILLVDPESLQIVMVNRTAQQNLGYSEEELLAKTILDVESALQDVFYWEEVRGGQYSNIESQEGLYLCADGSMRASKLNSSCRPYWVMSVMPRSRAAARSSATSSSASTGGGTSP